MPSGNETDDEVILKERDNTIEARPLDAFQVAVGDLSHKQLRAEVAGSNGRVAVYPGRRLVHIVTRPAESTSPAQLVQMWLSIKRELPGIQVLLERVEADAILLRSQETESGVERLGGYMSGAMRMLAEDEPTLGAMLARSSWRIAAPGSVQLFVTSPLDVLRGRRIDERLSGLLRCLTGMDISITVAEHQQRSDIVKEFQKEVEQAAMAAGMQQLEAAEPSEKKAEQPIKIAFGANFDDPAQGIAAILDEMRKVVIEGRVFGLETREFASGRQLIQFHLTDDTDSITCKVFTKGTKKELGLNGVSNGLYLRVRGSVQFDTYAKELVLQITDLVEFQPALRADSASCKRVELHAHTQMSALDGVIAATDLVKQAAAFGHRAVAVTDHGVVQAYPEAYAAANKYGIKVLYGIEAYLIDTGQTSVYRPTDININDQTTYVVFDTETTGLSAVENELIEVAGVKMRGGEVIDTFAELISPKGKLSAKITELTNITSDMLVGKPSVEEVLPRFREFCEGTVLVAHNAEFDMSFLSVHAERIGLAPFGNPVIDTLALARILYPNERNHRLKTLTQKFSVKLVNHHRALADSEATGKVFYKLLEEAISRKAVHTLRDLADYGSGSADYTRSRPVHATILIASRTGLKNMYRLVSQAHIDFFYREPRIPRNLLEANREGLLVGSGCKLGDLFQAMLRGKRRSEIRDLMRFYDFVELQPLDHYQPLLESEEIASLETVKEYHKQLLEIADELGKPVVATGDVHFLQPGDAVYREIIRYSATNNRDGGKRSFQPDLSFKTTEEMMRAFGHLGDRATEVVIDNTIRIAEQVESFSPLPDRVYPPIMDGADEQVRSLSYKRVHELYGEALPPVVAERLEKELHSIVSNGFSVNYLIAHKLVTKSLQDGYIVGSRGSVGSSFVATMMDITEVNPLPPHYLCKACNYSEFILDGSIGSGYDLANKDCPNCDIPLIKDGQDIPFETFLGFKGDKVPDIDLNFSGEYQARAHKYTEELFGTDFVYRAGTISTVAEKTAFGYVRKWADESGRQLRSAEIARLVAGCTGIKRTTGQHPGGLIIVPNDHQIYDFCPIQHPADDRSSETRTTHFDFHSIHDNLLKLDILGHDDPTVLRMLQDITGIDVRTVPVDDPQVYSLFSGTEALGVTPKDIRSNTGTYGVPEFGTKFVRQMLEDTKPATFADLVRISGLSHGTDVWLNNAQEIIRQDIAPLRDVICCRDDIMVYLIYRGLEPAKAFKIMESVRKGKGVSDDDATYMKSFEVADWYLDSCRKIKYMFPKAHAAAYVLNAVRIAYFKVHHPLAYYAAYFTVRAEDFDLELMARGADAIDARLEELEAKGITATPKEKALQTVLEVALEMTRRGFRFYALDLYQSDATRFLLLEDGLLPPFVAASGIGEAAAKNIVVARLESSFLSIEDLQERSRATKTVIELLERYGCLADLPASNQLSLF